MCLDTVDVNDKALMTGMRHVRGLYLTGPLRGSGSGQILLHRHQTRRLRLRQAS